MRELGPSNPVIRAQTLRFRWAALPTQARYLMIGLFNTVAGYGMFGGFLISLGETMPYFGILILSHIAAVTFSFLTHRHLVFQGVPGPFWIEYSRFQASYLWLMPQSLLINLGLVNYLGVSPWFAQVITTVLGVGTAYFMHRFFVFKGRQ